MNVYRTESWIEQHSSCFYWSVSLSLVHARTHTCTLAETHTSPSPPNPEAVEESNLGIAPRHEGQLCFSGTELKELSSSPSSPFPAPVARLPASDIPGYAAPAQRNQTQRHANTTQTLSHLKGYWNFRPSGEFVTPLVSPPTELLQRERE